MYFLREKPGGFTEAKEFIKGKRSTKRSSTFGKQNIGYCPKSIHSLKLTANAHTFSFPFGARPIFRCELLVSGRVIFSGQM